MHRKLARHQIPLGDPLELGKVRRRRRLIAKHNLKIPRILLLERFRHIRLCEQDLRQELVRPLLLVQVPDTRTLPRHIDICCRDVQAQNLRRLRPPPLMQISTPPHRQLQQRVARNHIRRVLTLLHPVMEGPHLIPLPRTLVVAVVHVVLERIVRRIRPRHLQHRLRDRDMNRCPD